MNEVTTVDQAKPKSVIISMADRFGMTAAAFEATVRATCMPTGRDIAPMTREEFAAGIMVAEKYTLNPILREIYFYPRKGGGIVPVVSVDGWLSLINRRKELDGIEFDELHDNNGKLISITCRIYRNDRKHATIVTEYLSECWRDTIPWKMPNRMLRHKALIQCARYAFGFSGIHDEDEAERIVSAVAAEAGPPAPPAPPAQQVAHQRQEPPAPPAPPAGPETVEEAEVIEQPATAAPEPPAAEPAAPFLFDQWIAYVEDDFASCKTLADLDEAHEGFEETVNDGTLNRGQRQAYEELVQNATDRIKSATAAAAGRHPEDVAEGQKPSDDDEDQGFPGDDAIREAQAREAPPEKTRAERHLDEMRAALDNPASTGDSLRDLWNQTIPLRKEMVESGEMTKETRNGLKADFGAVMARLDAGGAQDEGPPAPPPAGEPSEPPAPPATASTAAEYVDSVAATLKAIHKVDEFDPAWMTELADIPTIEHLNLFSAATLTKRNSFGIDNPHKTKWAQALGQKRSRLNGL